MPDSTFADESVLLHSARKPVVAYHSIVLV
jgi:hypothetical protein